MFLPSFELALIPVSTNCIFKFRFDWAPLKITESQTCPAARPVVPWEACRVKSSEHWRSRGSWAAQMAALPLSLPPRVWGRTRASSSPWTRPTKSEVMSAAAETVNQPISEVLVRIILVCRSFCKVVASEMVNSFRFVFVHVKSKLQNHTSLKSSKKVFGLGFSLYCPEIF